MIVSAEKEMDGATLIWNINIELGLTVGKRSKTMLAKIHCDLSNYLNWIKKGNGKFNADDQSEIATARYLKHINLYFVLCEKNLTRFR